MTDFKEDMPGEIRYASFVRRLTANLIDGILMTAWMLPALYYFYGEKLWTDPHFIMGPADFVISWILPMVGVLVLWDRRQATLGKMMLGVRIVAADSFQPLSRRQEIIRYFGCFLSALPVGAGFFWILFDPKSRGWHDRLAGSVVIHDRDRPDK
jgi:uncharacterized RDD family membrane protein YckC